jgi:dihydropteroate synthase
MESFNREDRLFAVTLTEKLFSERISFDDYLMKFPDDEGDEVLIELYQLIEEEEPVLAFGGESKLKQHSNMTRISELLKILRA